MVYCVKDNLIVHIPHLTSTDYLTTSNDLRIRTRWRYKHTFIRSSSLRSPNLCEVRMRVTEKLQCDLAPNELLEFPFESPSVLLFLPKEQTLHTFVVDFIIKSYFLVKFHLIL